MVTVRMERIAAITAAKVLEDKAAEYKVYVGDPANQKHISPAVRAATMADVQLLAQAADALRAGAR